MSEVTLETAAVSLLALFVVSLIGGLLPQFLKHRLSDARPFLRLADICAAGILSAAAFIHLLPDATEALEVLDVDYPVAGALALSGALAMYLLDLFGAPGNTGYVLAAALSMHAFVEGLALGASAIKSSTFSTILAAILLHKAFGAFALSAALVGAGVKQREVSGFALIFASVTPLAALAALVFVREALEEERGRVLSAVLTAVSAGVFAYIAFAELLQDKHSHAPNNVENELILPLTKKTNYGSTKKPIRYACKFCSQEMRCACNSSPKVASHEIRVSEKLSAIIFIAASGIMGLLAKWT